jgi:hypothetical protein
MPLTKGEAGVGYGLPRGGYEWLDGESSYDAPIA